MRAFPIVLLLPLSAVLAKTPQSAEPPPDPRANQKIERIRVEDGGTIVEELRVGGQTQTITVQPKGGLPAYELQPSDLARSRPSDRREGFSSGTQRVWKILSF